MKYITLIENTNTIIDNVNGWGSVPYNQNVNYMGLRVKMKPSIFLQLAAPLSEPTSKNDIINHLQNGGKIGAPFLNIKVPVEWSDDNHLEIAKVSQHEGRNRMKAILELYGDIPTETHLFFSGGINRNRHITSDIIKELQTHLYSENQNLISINQPLFTVMNDDNKKVTESINPVYAYPFSWKTHSPAKEYKLLLQDLTDNNSTSEKGLVRAEFNIPTLDPKTHYDHYCIVNATITIIKNKNNDIKKIIENFEFSIDYNYKTTNIQKTKASRIYATVAKVLQQIIQEVNPDKIHIIANELRKEKFYEKLINRIPQYHISNELKNRLGLKYIISKK
jgi:broad specificity polyphosphatase/5'/3'-nucleotidase SurE